MKMKSIQDISNKLKPKKTPSMTNTMWVYTLSPFPLLKRVPRYLGRRILSVSGCVTA